MKIGDLCTCAWEKGIFIFLGEGGYKGWYTVVSLKTGEKTQYQRGELYAVKKCP